MRPLSTRRSDEAGEADQAAHAGAAPVGEDGAHGDHDATQVTNEIQAPAPVGTPQVESSPDPLAAAAAGPGERGRLRRRLRKLKAVRARQRVELGTLVYDARKRSNGSRPEVVERRAAEAAEVERQVREIQHAVDAHADSRDLATGVAGSCQSCGALLSTEDRFCPTCGTPTKPGRQRPVDEAPAPPSADTGPQQAPLPTPTPARPLPATAPAEMPPPLPGTAGRPAQVRDAEPDSAATTESPALSGDTAESPAISAPPPSTDEPLARADPAAIPPPPPPPER